MFTRGRLTSIRGKIFLEEVISCGAASTTFSSKSEIIPLSWHESGYELRILRLLGGIRVESVLNMLVEGCAVNLLAPTVTEPTWPPRCLDDRGRGADQR